MDRKDSPEKEIATHSSILVWRIPWTEKPGGLQSMGSRRVRHGWATNTFLFCKIKSLLEMDCTKMWMYLRLNWTLNNGYDGDFPGGPKVKTSPSNAEGAGSMPGQGAKIPHDLQPKNRSIKQKQCCNKFNKKTWSTSKNLFKMVKY